MNLSYFLTEKLYDAGRKFFEQELGIYLSPSAVTNLPAKSLLGDYIKGKDSTLLEEIKEAYLLGKVDENSLGKNTERSIELETEAQKDAETYKGILVFAIKTDKTLSRTEIAKLTRALNRRALDKPVILLIFYNGWLSYSTADRTAYKQEWRTGEMVGKITMLKDINVEKVHAGHTRILWDMKVNPFEVDSFDKLYAYWKKIFSIQLLNDSFYKQLFHWYLWAKQLIKIPPIPKDEEQDEDTLKSIFTIRLLTRLLFVWFVKEKKLIPPDIFDEKYVGELLKKFNPASETEGYYYKAVLQNLFFATLNTPMEKDARGDDEHRQFLVPGLRNNSANEQYLDQTKYRHDNQLKESKKLLKVLSNVPFLNGGLFECLDYKEPDKPEIRYDGFSSVASKQPLIPEVLFFGKVRKVDLSRDFDNDVKKKQIDVSGIIDILNSYKFTITENTPLEEEIALDPELLGKVFENLLASYNPETKTTARKQTGSFYTPREIVSYMVDESLKTYLLQKLLDKPSGFLEVGKKQGDMFGNAVRKGQLKMEATIKEPPLEKEKKELEEKLNNLFLYSTDDNPFNPDETKLLIEAISNCKILDPACGSGAFPMGILHRMVHLLSKLDHNNFEWKKAQQKKAEGDLKLAKTMSDEEIRNNAIESAEQRIQYISESFDTSGHAMDYTRKLFLIENCIYGVDIQQIAIQISKLRFFISLMAEQKTEDKCPNRNILSMPNLETKFVAANTLIALDKPKVSEQLTVVEMLSEVKKAEEELKNLRSKIFFTRKYGEKKKLQKDEKKCREGLKKELIGAGFKKSVAEQMSSWNPFDQLHHAAFFDPETMFELKPNNPEEGVFDIIIGNPPYISYYSKNLSIAYESRDFVYQLKAQSKFIQNKKAKGRLNSMNFFVEKGISFLSKHGVLCHILDISINEKAALDIRKYITSKTKINEIIYSLSVFENVTSDQIILSLIKGVPPSNQKIKWKEKFDSSAVNIFQSSIISESGYSFYNSKYDSILKSLEKDSIELTNYVDHTIGVQIGGKNLSYKGKTIDTLFLSNKHIPDSYKNISDYEKYSPVQFEGYIIFDLELGKAVNKAVRDANIALPNNIPFLGKRKIILRQSSATFVATIAEKGFTSEHKFFQFKLKDDCDLTLEYLLGIINSRLMTFYGLERNIIKHGEKKQPQIRIKEFIRIPILNNKKQVKQIPVIVGKILSAKSQNPEADTSPLEKEIDIMVYHLYGLSYEEARVIEPGLKESDFEKYKIS